MRTDNAEGRQAQEDNMDLNEETRVGLAATRIHEMRRLASARLNRCRSSASRAEGEVELSLAAKLADAAIAATAKGGDGPRKDAAVRAVLRFSDIHRALPTWATWRIVLHECQNDAQLTGALSEFCGHPAGVMQEHKVVVTAQVEVIVSADTYDRKGAIDMACNVVRRAITKERADRVLSVEGRVLSIEGWARA